MAPTPSTADREAAEAFVREAYDSDASVCRTWLANWRSDLVRQAAIAEMQKREHNEMLRRRAGQWDQFFQSLERPSDSIVADQEDRRAA